MHKYKRAISLLLVLAMLFSMVGTAAAIGSSETDEVAATTTAGDVAVNDAESKNENQPDPAEEDVTEDQTTMGDAAEPEDEPAEPVGGGTADYDSTTPKTDAEAVGVINQDIGDADGTITGGETTDNFDAPSQEDSSVKNQPEVPDQTKTEETSTVMDDFVLGGKPVIEIDGNIVVVDIDLDVGSMFAVEGRNTTYFDPSSLISGIAPPTTYDEVYDRMIAMQEKYPEGLPWTNYTPYGTSGPLSSFYDWHGGRVAGNITGGVGCAAFAFILSDIAFGTLPARTISYGDADFAYENIRVGDVLRVYNNSHSVIVLKKSAAGIIVAEGNYNSSVHWGRVMSEAEVMTSAYIITRYPDNFVSADDAEADAVVQSGTEASLSWSLTKAGVLTISGNGAIPSYSPNDGQMPSWNAYLDDINTVIIEKGVTSIGDYAFYQSKALTVFIADSVTSIGQSAFRGSGLIAVTLPGSIKTIGDDAFRDCKNLTSASTNEGLEVIGERAFEGCTSLRYIDFPSTIKVVGAGAFASCSEMMRVRFMPGSSTVTIGDNLFSQCWYLTSVTLPAGADCISAGMFASCKMLSELYIPAGVTEVKGVGEASGAPFSGCTILAKIDFGGDEATWNRIGGASALTYSGLTKTQVNFNVEFDDPFATDPNDPGDLPPAEDDPCKDGHTGTADADGNCTVCGKPMDATTPPVTPPATEDHTHSWSTSWASDAGYHWHECTVNDCTITQNSLKDGYASHDYGEWVIDVNATSSQSGSRHRDCTACKYRQTETIPATGGSSTGTGSGSGNSGGSSGSSGSSGGTSTSGSTTTKNPDGSTTTTVTDRNTGIKTATTNNPDGSSIVSVTQKNGTVTNVTTTASGEVKTEVILSTSAINSAEQYGNPTPLPITSVQVTRDIASASTITVETATGRQARIAIPVTAPTAGTVAMIIKADGSAEVVKASVAGTDCLIVEVPSGTTVKVVDNAKDFSDIAQDTWYADAVDFASARGLFSGTSATTFSPELPMTRAMLMTVLANFDNAQLERGSTWYEKSVEWAIERGISDGTNPEANITREQLVVMLWRYFGSPQASENLTGFTDLGEINGYAQDAMRWAVERGVLNGFGDGRLGPQEQTTRAQIATVFQHLLTA